MCALQALSQYLVNINVWAHNILTLCARAFCSKEVRLVYLPCVTPIPQAHVCQAGWTRLQIACCTCGANQPAVNAQRLVSSLVLDCLADGLPWASCSQASRGITTAGDHGRLAWLVTTAAVVGYSLAVCVAVPFFFELVSGSSYAMQ